MISIIIPTFNRKEKLLHSVQSILTQTYKDFEILVVDDGSTDNTAQAVKNINDTRVKYFCLPSNQGAYMARNYGISQMTGDFFLTWDSDDEMFPDALQEMVKAAEQDNQIDMVYAPVEFVCNGKVEEKTVRESGYLTYEENLANKFPPNDALILVRKSIMGSDDFFLGPNIDSYFYVLLSRKARKIYHLNKILGRAFLFSDGLSETVARRTPNVAKSIKRANGTLKYLSVVGDEMKNMQPAKYAAICYGLASGLLLDNKKRLAIHYYHQAARHDNKYFTSLIFSLIPFSGQLLKWLYNRRGLLAKN